MSEAEAQTVKARIQNQKGLHARAAAKFVKVANAYDADGTQLRVTLVDRVVQAPYTVLGWRVRDVAATVRSLREAGVVFQRYEGMTQDEDDVWTAPGGSRVAWFADPDDNVLSLQQPPA